MSGINLNFDVVNQKGTPAFYSDIFANRPTYGYPGRVFISTDTGAIYEDTGSAWTLIADATGIVTTPNLQSVTGVGNSTSNGISITAGGLSSNSVSIVGGTASQFLKADGTLDSSTYLTTGSAASTYLPLAGGTLTGNLSIPSNQLAIGTATAGAPLDVHTTTGTAAQFNGTTTNNAFVFFQNAGTSKWRIGNLYNAGANSFQIYDTTNSTARLSIIGGVITANSSITASSALAQGVNFSNTLVAAANSDVLVGLDINPTFTNGAFTGVRNLNLRVGNSYAQYNTLGSALGIGVELNRTTGISGILHVGGDSSLLYLWRSGSNANGALIGCDYVSPSFGHLYFGTGVGTKQMVLVQSNGNLILQNGGTFTDAGYKLDVNGTARVQGILTTTANAVINTLSVGLGGGNLTSNTAIGVQSMNATSTGIDNTAVGYQSLNANTSGFRNTAMGQRSLAANTTGSENTGYGHKALEANTSGQYNVSIGAFTQFLNTIGAFNVGVGYQATHLNSTGSSNVGLGGQALRTNTTGNNNTAVGNLAGQYIADGVTSNSITDNSIYIGYNTKALANNQTNQIVIGYTTTGLGSNTTVIGNSSTLKTSIYGNLLVNTTTDSSQGVLQVSGGITAGGISLAGEVNSATATLSKAYYHVFNGGAGQTLTLPSPSSNNYQYVIINTTANTLTIAAATSTTIIDLTSSGVASITLIANARTLIIADGGTKYYQVF
jgi:hypothetical protein